MGADDGQYITIAVIDDDRLVRDALRSQLAEATTMRVIAEASDGDEILDLIDEHDPDVLLVDLRMPKLDGVEATRLVRQSRARQRILVLTAWNTDDAVEKALAAGADGFILKASPPGAIRQAITDITQGHRALDRTVVTQAVNSWTDRIRRRQEARARLDALTCTERDVAETASDGLSNQEISERLFMSVGNVKATLSRAFDKLGVTNRVQLAVEVMTSREH